MAILEKIHGHQDLIGLSAEDRLTLCREIRAFLVSHISETGGHLASNLGVVELSVAIETVFDTSKDRLVYDVGHQSYIHKILTGRQDQFDSLRKYGGLAGFPKPKESCSDAFTAGHASSSVSIALGMARARTILNQDYQVIAFIGDGAATGGMAYEGLNDASVSGEPMIVILNDNAMSIDGNVGGMAYHLRNIRAKPKYLGIKARYKKILDKIPGGKGLYRLSKAVKNWVRRMLLPSTIFESMGFTYLGPIDGHDTEVLIELLQNAKAMEEPVVLHVITKKGCGYRPAEENPRKFHGVGKFDPQTGNMPASSTPTFSGTFGNTMIKLVKEQANLCAITAAMPGGTGLLDFKDQYPDRLFDVGIAEEHAVSMAGGLAKQGMIPVVALYSTFLQRSFDMIMQDICMLNLHVVFAVDRAGLVGEDGETHHGMFDVGFLRQAPGMKILCPGSCRELSDMLCWAVCKHNGPVAVRYPRGGDGSYRDSDWQDHFGEDGGICKHRDGNDVTIITYGTLLDNALQCAELLLEKSIQSTVIRMLTVSPLPIKQIMENASDTKLFVILEETCKNSGIGESLSKALLQNIPGCCVKCFDLGHSFVPHGSIAQLHQHCGIDAKTVADYIQEVCSSEN